MNAHIIIQHADGRADRRDVTNAGIVTGACPGCQASPFVIRTPEPEILDDRTLRAGARCAVCKDAVGYVYYRPATIFGLQEDRAVLQGRPRVY